MLKEFFMFFEPGVIIRAFFVSLCYLTFHLTANLKNRFPQLKKKCHKYHKYHKH
jgi:hypothetical protein